MKLLQAIFMICMLMSFGSCYALLGCNIWEATKKERKVYLIIGNIFILIAFVILVLEILMQK